MIYGSLSGGRAQKAHTTVCPEFSFAPDSPNYSAWTFGLLRDGDANRHRSAFRSLCQ